MLTPRTNKFGTVTHVAEGHISRRSATPILRGQAAGPQRPLNFCHSYVCSYGLTQSDRIHGQIKTTNKWKKCSERRKHCALAVVRRSQKFSPAADPLPGAQDDGQNLISWRWSLRSPTDPVWWRSMHAISSYRGNRPTNKHTNTHTQTDRTDNNTLRR